jgi:hypothetical protein
MRFWTLTAARTALFASCVALICAASIAAPPARAEEDFDYNANEAFRLFSNTCLRYLGVPDDIRRWAARSRLVPITDTDILTMVVGAGTKGNAWALPSSSGQAFTLSIRSNTQACAVWAERADPVAVETLFKQMVNGAAKANPGVTLTTDIDDTLPTKSGRGRMLTMTVADKDGEGYLFNLIAGDQPGTMFFDKPIQVSMQMQRVAGKKTKKPAKP